MPMNAPILEDGAIVVHDGVVIDVGPAIDLFKEYSSAIYHDLGDVVLLPGLINAHCHLEYSMMHGWISSQGSFASWIEKTVKIKSSLTEEDYLNAIIKGCKQLRLWGCTTVLNTLSFPELLKRLPKLPLHCRHLLEVMDIRSPEQGEKGLATTDFFLNPRKQTSCDVFGISPHAPYTASKKLYADAQELSKKHGALFSTHLVESEEEFEMFTQRQGPLFEFLRGLGRKMDDCSGKTPIQALIKSNLLPKDALLIHMNIFNDADRELLTKRGGDFFIIHSPGSHHFFKRPPFDYDFFQRSGFSISLGTDSLASNEELNLFYEMRMMAASFPQLDPQKILEMVTLHPAAAIRKKGKIGELSASATADFITIPFSGTLQEASEAVVWNEHFPVIYSKNHELHYEATPPEINKEKWPSC